MAGHQIEIANQQEQAVDEVQLVEMIRTILVDHDVQQSEISLALVDDVAIRELNRQYLQHDYETDVISFVLDWQADIQHLAAQLIVSTDTAASLAAEVGGTMQEELLLYVIHGTLHLVGYDDKQPEDAIEMRTAEADYLHRVGIPHRGFRDDHPADDGPGPDAERG